MNWLWTLCVQHKLKQLHGGIPMETTAVNKVPNEITHVEPVTPANNYQTPTPVISETRNNSVLKFRAILSGVGGMERALQRFGNNKDSLVQWAKDVLLTLTPDQMKTAYVRVEEETFTVLLDLHPAITPGHYAATDYTVGREEMQARLREVLKSVAEGKPLTAQMQAIAKHLLNVDFQAR